MARLVSTLLAAVIFFASYIAAYPLIIDSDSFVTKMRLEGRTDKNIISQISLRDKTPSYYWTTTARPRSNTEDHILPYRKRSAIPEPEPKARRTTISRAKLSALADFITAWMQKHGMLGANEHFDLAGTHGKSSKRDDEELEEAISVRARGLRPRWIPIDG